MTAVLPKQQRLDGEPDGKIERGSGTDFVEGVAHGNGTISTSRRVPQRPIATAWLWTIAQIRA